MVLVWGLLARGNAGHTLVMVAINSLVMLLLYGVIGGYLLGIGQLPVLWQALLLSIAVYVALPLFAGFFHVNGFSLIKAQPSLNKNFCTCLRRSQYVLYC